MMNIISTAADSEMAKGQQDDEESTSPHHELVLAGSQDNDTDTSTSSYDEDDKSSSSNRCSSSGRAYLDGANEDSVASLTDDEYATFLEAKLKQIQQDHKESLLEIELHKKQHVSMVNYESKGSAAAGTSDNAPDDNDSLDALCAMMDALNENNQALCQQNDELCREIQEMKSENLKLLEQTTRLCTSCVDLKAEIEAARIQQSELKNAEEFLECCIKEYKKEYELLI